MKNTILYQRAFVFKQLRQGIYPSELQHMTFNRYKYTACNLLLWVGNEDQIRAYGFFSPPISSVHATFSSLYCIGLSAKDLFGRRGRVTDLRRQSNALNVIKFL